MIILGIDPGSRLTGYGLIESDGRRSRWLHSGVIKTGQSNFSQRLGEIFQGIQDLTQNYAIEAAAVEQAFMGSNANSALKLGQARGAAIAALVIASIPVYEYSPREVKQTLVGSGRADKEQVQHMVQLLLAHRQKMSLDESDALALAICHAHHLSLLERK